MKNLQMMFFLMVLVLLTPYNSFSQKDIINYREAPSLEEHYNNFLTINPEDVFLNLLNNYRKSLDEKVDITIPQLTKTDRTMKLAYIHGEYLRHYQMFRGENLVKLKNGKINPHWEYKTNPVVGMDLFTWGEKFSDRIDYVVIEEFVITKRYTPRKYAFNECITALTFPSKNLLSEREMKEYIRKALSNFHESIPHRKNIQSENYNEYGFHFFLEESPNNGTLLLVVTLNLAFFSEEKTEIVKYYYSHDNEELRNYAREQLKTDLR